MEKNEGDPARDLDKKKGSSELRFAGFIGFIFSCLAIGLMKFESKSITVKGTMKERAFEKDYIFLK